MRMLLGDEVPECWSVRLDGEAAAAVIDWLAHAAEPLPLGSLLADPAEREVPLHCVPLMLRRSGDDHLVPAAGEALRTGDEILFAGSHKARARQELMLQNANALAYVLTGREAHSGWLWSLLAKPARP